MYKYLEVECKEDGARLFPVVSSDSARGNGHTLTYRRFSLNSYCEGDKALAQIAQRDYGVSIFRDTQKLSRHGPGQAALVVLLEQERLGQMISDQRSLPSSAGL